MVSISLRGESHTIRLNEKLTLRGQTLEKLKSNLKKMKEEIINCIIDNINDQNDED